MSVLSFDCGTKNLAWSFLKKDTRINVIDYGIIDLLEKPKCTEKKCKKPASHLRWEDLEIVYCCKGHKEEAETHETHEKWKKIEKTSVQNICLSLIKKLDKLENIHESVDNIVIENQPSFKNIATKNIQIMLTTYFIERGKEVHFQNPSSKLFGYKITDKKNKYKDTKLKSIEFTRKLIDKEIFKDIVQKYSKIDDICDSILGGFCFLNDGKPPEELKELL